MVIYLPDVLLDIYMLIFEILDLYELNILVWYNKILLKEMLYSQTLV